MIIATAATLSLLLIGLLAVSMTPDRGGAPQAVSSTTSGSRAAATAFGQALLPLVTPIGDQGWALATTGAVKARYGTMSARLPSGDVVDVQIVHRDDDDGLTLVSLPTETDGYDLSASHPGPTDTVAVRGTKRTQVVEMVALKTLDVEEGAAVVDDDGDLVGLCTIGSGSVQVLTVSTMPASPTTSTTTPRQATTVAPATSAPTTVAATTVPTPTTTPVSTAPPTTPSTRPTSSAVPTTVAAPTTGATPTTVGVTSVDAAATTGSS